MRRLALLMIAVTLVATGCSSRAPKRPMATAPPVSAPPVSSDRMDVSGKWAGKWIGYGPGTTVISFKAGRSAGSRFSSTAATSIMRSMANTHSGRPAPR